MHQHSFQRITYHSAIVMAMEFCVDILVIYTFTLRRYSFVILFVLLFDNNYLLCHKNKQLEQVLEISMLYLMITLINRYANNIRKSKSNLSEREWRNIQFICNHPIMTIVPSDKNMGPVWLE